MAETELPAEHGEEISYKCSRKFVKMGGDVKLLCLDGELSFNEGSPECTKLGTLVVFLWCTGFGILIVALQYSALNLAP